MLHFIRISYIFDKTRENMREIENDGRMKINLKNILHTVIHFIYIYIFFIIIVFFPNISLLQFPIIYDFRSLPFCMNIHL